MKIKRLFCLPFLVSVSLQAAQAPAYIASGDLVPPSQKIVPMPLNDRIRLHAVPQRGMCSTSPAERAPDGLISGNGKMYVEVYGHPFSEQIVFHHERLLTPWMDGPLEAPNIAAVLPEVRRLILAGQYRKANELSLSTAAAGPTKPDTANLREHPAFTMRLNTPNQHAVHDYLRTIDFESGEVKVRWSDQDGAWESRTFVSRPDDVVVQMINAPPGHTIHLKVMLDTSGVLPKPVSVAPRTLTQRAGMPQPLRDPGATEVHFVQATDAKQIVLQGHYVVSHGTPGYGSVTRIMIDGGSATPYDNAVEISGSRALTLLTRIEANDDFKQADVDAMAQSLDALPSGYEVLLARHRPVQSAVMDRASLNFGGASQHAMSGEEMLTDQRKKFGYNAALLENLFDMGRYWLYLRSGEFPPIWGHVNINVNLQIAPAVMGNLPEAVASYVHWTEGLLPDSRTNARNIFGARGALFPIHPTQRGGELDHFAYGWPHHYWISAGGWMYSPIWDYYLATGDKQFLKDHVLRGLTEIGLFYEDYLSQTDERGKYIFVPSYSPENWPSNSESSPAVINADMDIMVCREVFTHLIQASETLGINSDSVPKWKSILAKLPPYLLDADGSLKEWAWPTLQEGTALDHRHESHMYGVWPGDEITPDQTPDLAQAAGIALRKRAQGNASAHGILHRALSAARLHDPYLLNFDLKQILEQGYVNASLTTLHNPYSYPAPDPQGGLPTIMMEMLVYSRPGVIGLLPALPSTLPEGVAKGIVCRTQATIDNLSWNLNTGKIDVTISSKSDQTISLSLGREVQKIDAPNSILENEAGGSSGEAKVRLSPARPVTLHILLRKSTQSQ